MLGKWWGRGLLLAAAWAVLTIAAGYLHTEVFLKGKLTEAEDAAISDTYGKICAGGIIGLFALSNVLWGRKKD